jgi:hypothetical protein
MPTDSAFASIGRAALASIAVVGMIACGHGTTDSPGATGAGEAATVPDAVSFEAPLVGRDAGRRDTGRPTDPPVVLGPT